MMNAFDRYINFIMGGGFLRMVAGVTTPVLAVFGLIFLIIAHFDNLAQVPIGEVVWKEFHPAYTTYQPMTINNTTTMQPVYHSKWWGVTVEGTRRDGDQGSYEWHVTPQEFEAYQIGDDYPSEEWGQP